MKDIHENTINEFVSKIDKENLKAVIIFGSIALGNYDDVSDLDVIVCYKSQDYTTPFKEYKRLASVCNQISSKYKINIKPIIKSEKEFLYPNFVTIPWRFMQHLYNTGKAIYENGFDFREKIETLWEKSNHDQRLTAASSTSPALIIRHRLYEMAKGNFSKIMNDEIEKFDSPPKYLWQGMIESLKLKMSTEDEKDPIKKIYKFVPIPSARCKSYDEIRNEVREANEILILNGLDNKTKKEIMEVWKNFKDLVEKDLWYFNKFLTQFSHAKKLNY